MNSSPLEKIPVIQRAREYKVYDSQGRRYLDFFQDNGRAIIGHRPSRVTLEMKNALSRGQLASYPSGYHYQTIKALAALASDVAEARIYSSFERAAWAAGVHAGQNLTVPDIADPAFPEPCSGGLCYWRPFLDMDQVDCPVLLPILPVSCPPAPAALLFRERPKPEVPQSDICSPVSLSAMKRGVYDLIEHTDPARKGAVEIMKGWGDFDIFKYWSRKGPYLSLLIDENRFEALFNELLSRSILISPFFPGPSIIPNDYSSGDFGKLKNLLSIGV
ncbi:MAG: hypothetical protein HN368_18030 [Spirochaetales bacterium]|jgi:hypothetical protein|nr:hypothetical protein [Spirochaetales bacterium]